MASHTAALHRELEAYKVSLIAETERIKAEQDVKKSLALKIAEKRFLAIAALLDAHLGLDTAACGLVTGQYTNNLAASQQYVESRREILTRINAYSDATSAATPFISAEVHRSALLARQGMIAVVASRPTLADPVVSGDDERVRDVLRRSNELELMLRELLESMEKFGGAAIE